MKPSALGTALARLGKRLGLNQSPYGGDRRFPASVPGFLFAPMLWACYFVALYSIEGTGCHSHFYQQQTAGLNSQKFALLGLMIAVALVTLAIGVWNLSIWLHLRRGPEVDPRSKVAQTQFLALTGAMVCGLFFVGTVWIGVSPAAFAACQGATAQPGL